MTIKHYEKAQSETMKQVETTLLYLAMVKKQSFQPEQIKYLYNDKKYVVINR
jgi:hypothetical protein